MPTNTRTDNNIARYGFAKNILVEGNFGEKPTENSVCKIIVSELQFEGNGLFSQYLNEENVNAEQTVTIGESDTALDRKLEKCLETMFIGESASVVIKFRSISVSFTLKLVHIEFNGFLFEWSANVKYELAQKHKNVGVELFKQNRHTDAFFRFSKAVKLLLTCALEVEDTSEEIDGIKIVDIESFKTVLYGNLASCHLKLENFEETIVLCTKVLQKDNTNTKAIYKRGMAYTAVRDFVKAEPDLVSVLTYEPTNLVAKNKLVYVREQLLISHKKFANMCEKMFR